ALEKEIAARTPSVDAFIAELRQAVAAGGVTMGASNIPCAPDETLYVPASSTTEVEAAQQTAAELAGTVSSAQLDPQEQAKLAAAREAYEREQQEKERIAREELARQEEERRRTEAEKERARQEKEEERRRREQEEREERE